MRAVEEIFTAALELPPEERRSYLEETCGSDPKLLAEVTALLSGHEAAETFLEHPAVDRSSFPVEEKAGDRLGLYELEEKLGDGGCGVVYRAQQTTPVRRKVALKVIKLGMDTAQVIARFEAERQALAMMDHPDIARVFDAGITERGRPYFVMELVEGVPVTDFADRHRLPLADRLSLLTRICHAVQHAHQKGIIHRDLKPSNILVAPHEGAAAPKIIDFGVAKAMHGNLTEQTLVTRFDQVIGTPAYMSPEQLDQQTAAIDTRTDVYALGSLLYELIAGTGPFPFEEIAAKGQDALRLTVRSITPQRPSQRFLELSTEARAQIADARKTTPNGLRHQLRGDLDWIVMRCLEKEPERRYASVRALADDLQRFLRQEPIEARPPSTRYRLRKFVARHRVGVASGLALAATLLGATIVSGWLAVRAHQAEQIAERERDLAEEATAAESLAREDAQRRQEQAEDLLTFMLGDFRSELAEIGRLSLLDSVGEKAMAYFDQLQSRDLSDTALTRQVKAITQIGEIRLEQARYAEASEAFAIALSRATALVDRYPENADYLFERAQVEYWIGYTFLLRANNATAREWLTLYRDSCLRLLELEGPTFRARNEVAYGHHNLAALDFEDERFEDAEVGFAGEYAMLRDMQEEFPDNEELIYRLGSLANWRAYNAEREADFAFENEQLEEALKQFGTLASRHPDNPGWKVLSARAITGKGNIAFLQGRWDEAEMYYQRALAVFSDRAREDPDNSQNLLEQNTILLNLGETAMARADTLERAESLLASGRSGFAELAAAETTADNFRRGVGRAWRLEARRRDLLHKPLDEVLEALHNALAIDRELITESPTERWNITETSWTLLHLGHLADRVGESEQAREHWEEALSLLTPDARDSRDWRLLDPYVQVLDLLGHPDEADAAREYLRKAGYVPANPVALSNFLPLR